MPLTAQEKNALASGGQLFAQAAIVKALSLGLGGAGLLGLAFLPLSLGLAAQFGRVRFPRLSPGDIGRAAAAARQGSVISSDPFFGDVVISQPDQAEFLTELVRNSAIRRVTAEQDTSREFLIRRGVIEGLAESAQARGFPATTAEIEDLRVGVFRPAADAPLEIRQRNFML